MGTNRRYADQIDDRVAQRALEVAVRGQEPITLSDLELELDKQPLTRLPKPKPVRAWVRYPRSGVLVNAEVVAWTPYAVAIRWRLNDVNFKGWVWAPAVLEWRE